MSGNSDFIDLLENTDFSPMPWVSAELIVYRVLYLTLGVIGDNSLML